MPESFLKVIHAEAPQGYAGRRILLFVTARMRT